MSLFVVKRKPLTLFSQRSMANLLWNIMKCAFNLHDNPDITHDLFNTSLLKINKNEKNLVVVGIFAIWTIWKEIVAFCTTKRWMSLVLLWIWLLNGFMVETLCKKPRKAKKMKFSRRHMARDQGAIRLRRGDLPEDASPTSSALLALKMFCCYLLCFWTFDIKSLLLDIYERF